MAQLIDLGKIRFSYKGVYNIALEYTTNDVVKYGANVYAFTSSTPATGQVPTNTTYWTLMLEGFIFLGDYDDSVSYKLNDVVIYGSGLYVAAKPNTDVSPNDPVPSGQDPTWIKISDGFQYEGEYDNSTTYQVNDIVSYGGNSYIAIDDTVGNIPTNASYWEIFTPGMNYSGPYNNSTPYKINDVVTYGGSTWICVDNTTGNAPEDSSSFWETLAPGTYPSLAGNANSLLTTDGTAVSWTNSIDLSGTAQVDGLVTIGPDAELFVDPLASGEPSLVNPAVAIVFDSGVEESSYAQIAFQNRDATSSTDIIAYMDNGNTDEGWVGIGISGSNFDDATYGITGPGDGYIFHNAIAGSGDAGNLVLATGANGTENKLIFAAGGFDSGLTQMEITPGVNVHVEIPTPSTSPTTGAFTVVGGVGIQGDMNIQGNVDIVGTISFGGSGTTVTTQNLAVSDPTVFVGSNNLSDGLDLGLIAEYAIDVVDQVTSVNNKALSSNVATLTTTAAHGYSVGDVVVISGVDATFNGTYIISAVPDSTSFRYEKTAGNVSSTAVSPAGTATVTHERRWGGVVRDVTDGVIKFFVGSTEKPGSTVDFANPGLSFAPIKAGASEFSSVTTTNLTASGGTSNLGGTVNITSAADFTGSNVTLGSGTWSGSPTFSGSPVFSGSPSFTGTPTFTGGIRVQEMIEDVVDVTHSSNTVSLDYSAGNIFYLTNTLSANATANIINAPTTDGRIFTTNLVVTQGSTGYIPATLNVNGSSVTIKWANSTIPTPTSSAGKIDIFNFTLIRRGGTWTALGSINNNY